MEFEAIAVKGSAFTEGLSEEHGAPWGKLGAARMVRGEAMRAALPQAGDRAAKARNTGIP